jgi:hypothetical protein
MRSQILFYTLFFFIAAHASNFAKLDVSPIKGGRSARVDILLQNPQCYPWINRVIYCTGPEYDATKHCDSPQMAARILYERGSAHTEMAISNDKPPRSLSIQLQTETPFPQYLDVDFSIRNPDDTFVKNVPPHIRQSILLQPVVVAGSAIIHTDNAFAEQDLNQEWPWYGYTAVGLCAVGIAVALAVLTVNRGKRFLQRHKKKPAIASYEFKGEQGHRDVYHEKKRANETLAYQLEILRDGWED